MKLRLAFFFGLLILSCTPTEPCACPPATSIFRVHGKVRDYDHLPVAGALLAARAPADDGCAASDAETFEVFPSRTDQAGAFDATLRSFHRPRQCCLRFSVYRGSPGSSDSVVLATLVVTFRSDREQPDSLGLVIRLP